MVHGSDLGWWGRHPVFYVASMTVGSVLCLAGVVAGIAAGSWCFAATAGLFAVLMSYAAVYAWHWWFVGRHRDKSANDRLRWRLDMVLTRIGFGVLGLLFLLLVVWAALGMYDSLRLDRYGVTGNATVERIERHKASDSIFVTVRAGDGVRHIELEGDGDELAVGDVVAIVYDPDSDHNEGSL